MGIRFRCHHCEHELNLKEFQAGRRARCPACSGRFRVPTESTDFSMALEESEVGSASLTAGQSHGGPSRSEPSFELAQPLNDPELVPQPRRSSSSDTHSTAKSRTTSSSSARATQSTSSSKQKKVSRAASSQRPAESSASNATASSSSTNNPYTQQQPAIGGQAGMPRAIAEAPQAVWYVRPPGGGQYGPADGHLFYQWLADSRISPDSLVWRDGWPQWQSAGDAFEDHFGSAWRLASDVAIDAAASEPEGHADSEHAGSGHSDSEHTDPEAVVAPGELTIRESVGSGLGTVTDYLPQSTESPSLSTSNHQDSQTKVSQTKVSQTKAHREKASQAKSSKALASQPFATQELAPRDQANRVSPQTSIVTDAVASSPVFSVAEARRRKKRTQYAIMIAVLALLAIALLVVFVMVIFGGVGRPSS